MPPRPMTPTTSYLPIFVGTLDAMLVRSGMPGALAQHRHFPRSLGASQRGDWALRRRLLCYEYVEVATKGAQSLNPKLKPGTPRQFWPCRPGRPSSVAIAEAIHRRSPAVSLREKARPHVQPETGNPLASQFGQP